MGLETDYNRALDVLEALNNKFDAFVSGSDTDTVEVTGGEPIPSIRNFLRRLKVSIGGEFNDAWDVANNTPNLAGLTPDRLDYFIVTNGGVSNITGSNITWEVGDEALYIDGDWYRIPKHNSLSSATVFSDDAARIAAQPAFVGQIGAQINTRRLYVADGTNAGDWVSTDKAEFTSYTFMKANLNYAPGTSARVTNRRGESFKKVGPVGDGHWELESVNTPPVLSQVIGDPQTGSGPGNKAPQTFKILKDNQLISTAPAGGIHEAFPGICYHPPTGTVVVCWRQAPRHAAASGEATKVMVWLGDSELNEVRAPVAVLSHTAASNLAYVDQQVTCGSDGRIWLKVTEKNDNTNFSHIVIYVADGPFAEFVEVSRVFAPASAYNFVFGATPMIELPDGRWGFTGATYDQADLSDASKWANHFYRSLDASATTWESFPVATPSKQDRANESSVTYYKGKLIIISRGASNQYRFESTDLGTTWDNGVDITPPDWGKGRPNGTILENGCMPVPYRRLGGVGTPLLATTYDFGDTYEAGILNHNSDPRRQVYVDYALSTGGTLYMVRGKETGNNAEIYVGEIAIGAYTDTDKKQRVHDIAQVSPTTGGKLWSPDISLPPGDLSQWKTVLTMRNGAETVEDANDYPVTFPNGSTGWPQRRARFKGPRNRRYYTEKISGGQYMQVGTAADYAWMHQTKTFTIGVSFMLEPGSLANDRAALFSTGGLSGTTAGPVIILDNLDSRPGPSLYFQMGSGIQQIGSTLKYPGGNYIDGDWHRLIFVSRADVNSGYFYLDGEFVGNTAYNTVSTGTADAFTPLRSGLLSGGASINSGFNIADIAISNLGLNAFEGGVGAFDDYLNRSVD